MNQPKTTWAEALAAARELNHTIALVERLLAGKSPEPFDVFREVFSGFKK